MEYRGKRVKIITDYAIFLGVRVSVILADGGWVKSAAFREIGDKNEIPL